MGKSMVSDEDFVDFPKKTNPFNPQIDPNSSTSHQKSSINGPFHFVFFGFFPRS
jgi:hypothetical protein